MRKLKTVSLLGFLCFWSSAGFAFEFDADRYSTAGEGRFKTFHVSETQTLQWALDNNIVSPKTELLVVEVGDEKVALLKDQMAFHHIAQGKQGDKDWMATF